MEEKNKKRVMKMRRNERRLSGEKKREYNSEEKKLIKKLNS